MLLPPLWSKQSAFQNEGGKLATYSPTCLTRRNRQYENYAGGVLGLRWRDLYSETLFSPTACTSVESRPNCATT